MPEVSGLARELRLARKAAGLTREQMAEKTGLSASLIDKVERGVVPVSETYVTAAARELAPYIDVPAMLTRMHADGVSRQQAVPDWFEVWREMIEPHATFMRIYAALLVPGLLQTEGYSGAQLADAARVAARMGRQAVFDCEAPLEVVAVIAESVLHHCVGSPEIMYDQLQHLASPPGTVRVHILPASTETHLWLDGPFEIATLDGAERVWVDAPIRGHVLDTRADRMEAERRWHLLSAEALPWRHSRELILKVATERWKNEGG